MPSGGANKFSYDYVKSVLEKYGFKLLDKKYVNTNTPIRCVCVCGNEVMMRFSHIKKGERSAAAASRYLKEEQIYKFKGQGIAHISSDQKDIYNVSTKSDIIVKIMLI